MRDEWNSGLKCTLLSYVYILERDWDKLFNYTVHNTCLTFLKQYNSGDNFWKMTYIWALLFCVHVFAGTHMRVSIRRYVGVHKHGFVA